MKKIFVVGLLIALALGITVAASAKSDPVIAEGKGPMSECTTIQDGTLETTTGEIIETGFDEFGYNYQARLFNGRYCDFDRVSGGSYCDVHLAMKWNEGWLSNKDCDGDDLLDRHFGHTTYIGSGAWLTNHQSGEYEMDGKTCKWNYFVKIVAAPETAFVDAPYDIYGNGTYYAEDGTEIGAQIWGAFAVIQIVENDVCGGIHGLQYNSPDHSGLGGW